jgi:hypothetical protein
VEVEIEAAEFVGGGSTAGTLPLHADPRSPYFWIRLKVLDYDACNWEKELGYPSPAEQPMARVTVPMQGSVGAESTLMRSLACADGTDPVADCNGQTDMDYPIWRELEGAALSDGLAVAEVPLALLGVDTKSWAVADSICRGKKICHKSIDITGDDPPGIDELADCECLEGVLDIHNSDLTIIAPNGFGHLLYASKIRVYGNQQLDSIQGLNGLKRVKVLDIDSNHQLLSTAPAFESLTHPGHIHITGNSKLTNWANSVCPTDLTETCFPPVIKANLQLANCVANRCIQFLEKRMCDPGPWCTRLHEIAKGEANPDVTPCPEANYYACDNNVNCSCSGTAETLAWECKEECESDTDCDTDFPGMKCMGLDDENPSWCYWPLANAWSVDISYDPTCENYTCPVGLGCSGTVNETFGYVNDCMCN